MNREVHVRFCEGLGRNSLGLLTYGYIVRTLILNPEAKTRLQRRGSPYIRFRVESGCGAVVAGLVCLLPPLSSGGAQVTAP